MEGRRGCTGNWYWGWGTRLDQIEQIHAEQRKKGGEAKARRGTTRLDQIEQIHAQREAVRSGAHVAAAAAARASAVRAEGDVGGVEDGGEHLCHTR